MVVNWFYIYSKFLYNWERNDFRNFVVFILFFKYKIVKYKVYFVKIVIIDEKVKFLGCFYYELE